MKIYLVRHPETEKNRKNETTGWKKSEYSKRGEKQFEKIAKYLKKLNGEIISSDLPRCLKLAKAITKNPKKTKLLRERNIISDSKEYETRGKFEKRVEKFLEKITNKKDITIITHAGTAKEIIRKILPDKVNRSNRPRDHIFLIDKNNKNIKFRTIKLE